jgi:hypothetical protein
MGRIFIAAITLYAIFLACYLVRERRVKRRHSAARRKGKTLFSPPPPEDIIGKSQFDLRHSRPQATTLIQSEKRDENDSTFADGSGKTESQSPPAAVPPDDESADDSGDVNIMIDNEPTGDESDSWGDNVDTDESEYAEDVPTGAAMATGVSFDELSDTIHAVNDPDTASGRDRERAGRTLIEVRQTEIFGQIADRPEKQSAAGRLMDDYLAGWNRRKREAGEMDDGGVRAPSDFNPRAFAR